MSLAELEARPSPGGGVGREATRGGATLKAGDARDRPREAWAFGSFRLLACGTLLAGERIVPLTPKEEAVLRALVAAAGRRVSKDELVAAGWGDDAAVSDASLARAVHTLRRKLGAAGGDDGCVRTSYARGYQLTLPVERLG